MTEKGIIDLIKEKLEGLTGSDDSDEQEEEENSVALLQEFASSAKKIVDEIKRKANRINNNDKKKKHPSGTISFEAQSIIYKISQAIPTRLNETITNVIILIFYHNLHL